MTPWSQDTSQESSKEELLAPEADSTTPIREPLEKEGRQVPPPENTCNFLLRNEVAPWRTGGSTAPRPPETGDWPPG